MSLRQELSPAYYADSNRELALNEASGRNPNQLTKTEEVVRQGAIRDVILKVVGPCNLGCDYCYMYEHQDASWKTKPPRMSDETVETTAVALGVYARKYQIPALTITLHGGEPFMQPPEFFDGLVESFRRNLPRTRLGFTVQTNGTRLTERYLQMAARHNMGIGVSLDGGETAQNRHRRFLNGKRGSFAAVHQGLQRITANPAYYRLLTGILATIDTANDPIETYEALVQYKPREIDFFMPMGNWSYPPPGRGFPSSPDYTPYADWLIAVFERWYADGRRYQQDPNSIARPPIVRCFQDIIQRAIDSNANGSERFGRHGMTPNNIVVNTDGAIEMHDALRTNSGDTVDSGFNVDDVYTPIRNPFDFAEIFGQRKLHYLGGTALAQVCLECDLRAICGAGFFADRHNELSNEPPLRHPSVYHPDLQKLIRHIVGPAPQK